MGMGCRALPVHDLEFFVPPERDPVAHEILLPLQLGGGDVLVGNRTDSHFHPRVAPAPLCRSNARDKRALSEHAVYPSGIVAPCDDGYFCLGDLCLSLDASAQSFESGAWTKLFVAAKAIALIYARKGALKNRVIDFSKVSVLDFAQARVASFLASYAQSDEGQASLDDAILHDLVEHQNLSLLARIFMQLPKLLKAGEFVQAFRFVARQVLQAA